MPRPQRAPKALADTLDEMQVMELRIGPDRVGAFVDDAHRRQAWERHRDELLDRRGHPASRPWAFWQYDAPAELRETDDYAPGSLEDDHDALLDRRLTWLLERGELAEWEIDGLLRAGADAEETLASLDALGPDLHGNVRFHQAIVRRASAIRASIGARVGG